ncbi:MAG: DUF2279 domain-containing protein [Candidatus Edwardsbacteria bacterium]|nr:DUF2279 domain-containing protein [Candidatus Edwardsbacteria bacterium]
MSLAASLAAAQPAANGNGSAPPARDRWLARDKAAHAALSFALVGLGYHLATRESGWGRSGARNATVAVTIALGVAKETRDGAARGGGFSTKDLAADLLGTACGALLFTRR